MNSSRKKALIYCRVSSLRQKEEGQGLQSQEQRCRKYAEDKGYVVENVFGDSYSGAGDFFQRPAMADMFLYIDGNIHNEYVIIFDDLKRFARDTVFHWKLRKELDARGATVECLNFTFEDTPEGQFLETILAAQGELERKQNRRQVIQKMKARLENGYWPFHHPPGYRSNSRPGRGKVLVPYEEEASIIREAAIGYASGRFPEQIDVQRFLQNSNFLGRKKIYLEQVKRLLTRVLYAGYVEYPEWDVERRKGHHEPLYSLEVYEQIQAKLEGRMGIRTRKDINEDFPLRGFLHCADCHKPLTASWSTGRNKKYPFYRCSQSTCPMRGKSVRKEKVEEAFEDILRSIQPSEEALKITKLLFTRIWNKKIESVGKVVKTHKTELNGIETEIEALLRQISRSRNEKIIDVYESEIEKLNERKLALQEKVLLVEAVDDTDFGTALDRVFEYLKNPYLRWDSGDIYDKRLALKLVFAEPLVYDIKNGFGTVHLSLPLRVFELSMVENSQYVEMGGIEPPSKLSL